MQSNTFFATFKRFPKFIILLCANNVFAQIGDTYKPKMDAVFFNLDKSRTRIPTGILYESGYNLIEDYRLDANAGKPIDFEAWKIFYYSIASGTVNNANPISASYRS